MHRCAIILLCGTLLVYYSGCGAHSTIRSATYVASCRHDNHYVSQTTEPSLLVCSRNCADDDICEGFSTCPLAGRRVLCQLFDNASNGTCVNPSPGCTYMEMYKPCQNGGSNAGLTDIDCICAPGWAGTYCERRYRDCYEVMFLSDVTTGWFTIQPFNYPVPFDVYCNAGSTYFLRRGRDVPPTCPTPFSPNGSLDYFIHTHGTPEDGCDFFLGLGRLSAILQQGVYIMDTVLQYHFPNMTNPVSLQAQYMDFVVQNKVSGFALNHGHYMDQHDTFLNPDDRKGMQLFETDRPRRFCTTEDDNCACAKVHDASWWYSNGCQLEFPLTALPPDLKISIDGVLTELSLAVMTFYPYYYN